MTWRIWQIFVHRLKNSNFISESRMAEQNPNKNSKQPDRTDAVWKLYVKWIAQLTKRFTHSTESMFLRYEKIFKKGVNSLSVGRGHRKFCWGEGGNFFTGGWEPQEEWFWWFQPFSKLKRAFCEYWTSIKIKVSMTCVSKKYGIKTKMVQKQWLQLKIMFYWVITWKFVFTGGNWLL